jgi:hypothetical protein
VGGRLVGDDGRRALGDGSRDELVAVAGVAAHGYKQAAGLHLARIGRNGGNIRITSAGLGLNGGQGGEEG